ncbi:MAG: hypothetical protein E7147_05475 [Rikenellaceae bacterium]|nr:hypothetical protein [Rikenellaceae bacterium]
MKRFLLSLLALVAVTFVVEAQKAPKQVKFAVEMEQSFDKSLGGFVEGDMVVVNGKVCPVVVTKKGTQYVEADKSDDALYKAAYPGDAACVNGATPYIDLVPAQHYKDGSIDHIYMPMYTSQIVDKKITLKPLCGIVSLTLSGEASINCIKLESNTSNALAGRFLLDTEKGELRCNDSGEGVLQSLILDCSNGGKGVTLDKSGKVFYAVLPIGKYEKGLKLSITDRNHHSMSCTTAPFEVKRGVVTPLTKIAYTYPAEQLFVEHFDNMVFGGDYMQGKKQTGYVPVANEDAEYKLKGSERAVCQVANTHAGSDYMQKNWKLRPADDDTASAEYLANRNLADYGSLLRAQEYQGYIGVGVKDHSRGKFESPAFSEVEEYSDIEISFKFSPEMRCTTDYNLCVLNAGVVKEFWIDDVRHTLSAKNYPFQSAHSEKIIISRRSCSVGTAFADDEQKPWFTVRLVVSGATDKTSFSIMAQKMGEKEKNGFYIDDIEVKLLRHVPRKNILRVMDYNIQNGMWADQHNNYDNFVKYMVETDVDIAIFCEASSIYYDFTNKHAKREERYLPYKYQPYEKKNTDHLVPTGWIELAARYGHPYVAVGAHQDNYPVVVTSKYPIVKSVKLGGEEVSHGGIHAQVEVDGEIINIVGFHTWPHGWKFGVREKEARALSKLEYGGHITRYDETKLFMERTVLNPEYADQKHWIVTGDMNCYSPLDDAHWDLGYSNPRYAAERYIVEEIQQVKDLIKYYNCPDKRDVLVPSAMRGGRIDFMYGSERFVTTLLKAKSPKSGFTKGKYDKTTRFFKERGSDHLPIICDFEWR